MKSIAVFCGSSLGKRELFAAQAAELIRQMHGRHFQLVYGGGDVGVMKVIADEMLQLGGRVIGVIPQKLVDVEIAHPGLTEMHVVQSMSERKVLMEQLSDAFVMLPGGAGTLDEFFEMLTLAMLSYHNKPCAILNTDGYYNSLLKFLDESVEEDFFRQVYRDMIIVEDDPSRLLNRLVAYEAPTVLKWS